MLLKLIPDQTHIGFTRMRYAALAFSALLVVASLGAVFTLGFNFGVDFRGGVTIEVADEEPIDIGEVRTAMNDLGLGSIDVQEIQDFAGTDKAVLVRIAQQQVDGADGDGAAERAQQQALATASDALQALLGDDIEFRKREVVGPTVSGELIQKGALAIALAIGMMLIYIWLRFEWQFSMGAIIALVHDVIITLGMFAVTRLEFNLAIIAAILTIVGYSMNDTVVVYDRVRENLRKFKQKPLSELIDLSINDTLSRTIMTSGTTMLALAALAVFGGEVLRGFTLAMIWGVVIGTYSSIFVASPFLLATDVKRDWSKAVPAGA
ncbi:protein translocase subunit SecF [Hyphococcus luteus]|jgi:preprotein translocase SecF subunit|uniref:Protein-export membrane protein SecF n=1 Tax=Hyphococcus luteus TaxID=2058213 RepID=A0A2S7K4F6_9PROT|nr:protein translocase subunit SecF [Marinicaulis flavus]PQA87318.1 protein translocase subunit SecF [Marinicaulis flavus]